MDKSGTDSQTEQTPKIQKSYRTALTRADKKQLSGHFPTEAVKIFKRIAVEHDLDVQELLGECINTRFEAEGEPYRIEIKSGRRKRSKPLLESTP